MISSLLHTYSCLRVSEAYCQQLLRLPDFVAFIEHSLGVKSKCQLCKQRRQGRGRSDLNMVLACSN
jgi:hypothetical protein